MSEELFEKIKTGDIDAVEELLEEDPSLSNQPNEEGAYPLHFATLLERREIVQVLVNNGADINARDLTYAATPMGWVIEYLREMGALLSNEIDDLAFAIEERDGKWAARLLERFPALRTARDKEGRLLAELALETGDREIMQAFIERE
ncbi:MAG: ankyrin repeat domain-containing protein [Gammaproteobacteria bacterium]|nr:ankyrin repeat domain-containing protein [Gammaproteobacteria bacterium]NND38784.1 hypothetical protein [Pseudomonadales bacterium]NNL10923.1 hypothetical protein [Pseudomonadales bacterium]NNM10870.1 hypothetical protein [Pseudomonadales bacterium]RZV49663.1 MAG: ankyrin repeat domain-containing protein [Pseudomonadales bacterium]